MATATTRVPVLMTEEEKSRIVAKAAGFSMGEYMRRAANAFDSSENDKALEGMLEQVLKATAKAETAIDDAVEYIAASNKRIAAMEAARKNV